MTRPVHGVSAAPQLHGDEMSLVTRRHELDVVRGKFELESDRTSSDAQTQRDVDRRPSEQSQRHQHQVCLATFDLMKPSPSLSSLNTSSLVFVILGLLGSDRDVLCAGRPLAFFRPHGRKIPLLVAIVRVMSRLAEIGR